MECKAHCGSVWKSFPIGKFLLDGCGASVSSDIVMHMHLNFIHYKAIYLIGSGTVNET